MSLAHGFRVAVSDRSSLIASAATDRARASTRRGREFLPTASKSALPLSTVSSFDARRGPARARRAIVTRAERETRLVSVLTSLPRRLELYFARRSYRVTLWRAISVFFGFYLANVMTLSFGALGINDVVAGALSVAFYEIVTRIYYSTLQQNKWLEFVNWFKVGYCYSLIADAFKLGS
ncbi:hypothetical protein BE221DRAFT_71003 [Ostreococcus tauri]|uniref:DUF565 domain-containing protein n=1 Tax=Ostreococcus tauri TaxID=70448 RepID=A0A1Y5IG93_OSTTA|nr:hypothetical protein BE221DRAFT_71003 [Ostreococcus tauri]